MEKSAESSLDEQLKLLQSLDEYEYEILKKLDSRIKTIHERVEWILVSVWLLSVAIICLIIAYAFSL